MMASAERAVKAVLKRQIMGRKVVAAITDGRLDFGPWGQTFYTQRRGGVGLRFG